MFEYGWLTKEPKPVSSMCCKLKSYPDKMIHKGYLHYAKTLTTKT